MITTGKGETLTESQWLERRKATIGGSEAAAVMGISPYCTPLELYYRKTGQLPDQAETMPMRIGKKMEPILVELYEEETGEVVTNQQAFLVSSDHPFMSATLDGMVVSDRRRVVELKSTNVRQRDEWGDHGTDQIPKAFLIQVHHQMIVAELDSADVAVLIGNGDFRVYQIPRHEQLCRVIIDREAEFWDAIKAGKPPKERPEDAAILSRIRPGLVAEVDISDNPEAMEDAMEYQSIGLQIKELEERKALHKYKIIRAMGEHSSARLADGTIAIRKMTRRKEHTVKASEFPVFTLKTPKEEDWSV